MENTFNLEKFRPFYPDICKEIVEHPHKFAGVLDELKVLDQIPEWTSKVDTLWTCHFSDYDLSETVSERGIVALAVMYGAYRFRKRERIVGVTHSPKDGIKEIMTAFIPIAIMGKVQKVSEEIDSLQIDGKRQLKLEILDPLYSPLINGLDAFDDWKQLVIAPYVDASLAIVEGQGGPYEYIYHCVRDLDDIVRSKGVDYAFKLALGALDESQEEEQDKQGIQSVALMYIYLKYARQGDLTHCSLVLKYIPKEDRKRYGSLISNVESVARLITPATRSLRGFEDFKTCEEVLKREYLIDHPKGHIQEDATIRIDNLPLPWVFKDYPTQRKERALVLLYHRMVGSKYISQIDEQSFMYLFGLPNEHGEQPTEKHINWVGDWRNLYAFAHTLYPGITSYSRFAKVFLFNGGSIDKFTGNKSNSYGRNGEKAEPETEFFRAMVAEIDNESKCK